MKRLKRMNIGLIMIGLTILAIIIAISVEGAAIDSTREELIAQRDEFIDRYAERILPPEELRSEDWSAYLGDPEGFAEDERIVAALGDAENSLREYFPDEGPHWAIFAENLLEDWQSYFDYIAAGNYADGLSEQDVLTAELHLDLDGYYSSRPNIRLRDREAVLSSFSHVMLGDSFNTYLDYNLQWVETEAGWRVNSVAYPVVRNLIQHGRW